MLLNIPAVLWSGQTMLVHESPKILVRMFQGSLTSWMLLWTVPFPCAWSTLTTKQQKSADWRRSATAALGDAGCADTCRVLWIQQANAANANTCASCLPMQSILTQLSMSSRQASTVSWKWQAPDNLMRWASKNGSQIFFPKSVPIFFDIHLIPSLQFGPCFFTIHCLTTMEAHGILVIFIWFFLHITAESQSECLQIELLKFFSCCFWTAKRLKAQPSCSNVRLLAEPECIGCWPEGMYCGLAIVGEWFHTSISI